MGHNIPWDLIISVVVAVLGSSGLWQFLQRRSGTMTEIAAAISDLKEDIKQLREKQQSDVADQRRTQILSFDAELRKKYKHTEEEFVEIINIIDKYEAYCTTHPKYPNNKSTIAMKNIKESYQRRLEDRDYL